VPDRFPQGFLWGAATAAYQIEGSPLADGAGPSIWHRFAHTPGRMANGDTGDIACDHYNRSQEDVALMRELNLNAYRFSISWSRILPEGTGPVNQKGLDFYRRLVEALREAGIAPSATLYHWDLPAALDDRGGWLNRDSASWFGDYAEICFKALGDQVEMWATLNEPWVIADGGYLYGTLAPGHSNLFEAPRVAHHLLLAHATAVEAFRAHGPGKIGIVVNIEPKHPASDSPEDLAATQRADAAMNRHYLDPLFLGRYPEELAEIYGQAWPDFPEADLDRIPIPFDWLGLNYYTRAVVQAHPAAWPTGALKVHQPRSTYTETHWEVYPKGLEETLHWLADRYGPIPLYVTENGAAFYDPPTAEGGKVDDPLRVEYLREHLRAVGRAIEAGVDVRGYFAWSLFDNLEWSLGYAKRFGIVHVDFATLERTVKASGRFYAGVAGAGREEL
jgi:beta-glucosidase